MEELVIYQSKGKRLRLVLLGILMTALSIFILTSERYFLQYRKTLVIVGVLGAIFFGVATLFFIKKLFQKDQVILKVDGNGFQDQTSSLKTGFILWSDVEKIEKRHILSGECISIYLKDNKAFLNKLSFFNRKAAQANLKLGYGGINITLNAAKKKSKKEIYKIMQDHFQAFQINK